MARRFSPRYVLPAGLLALSLTWPALVIAAETPKPGGTLTVASEGQEPACLDPLINATAGVIASHPYSDSLVWQTEDGRFLPWLSESWTISDDGEVYTFALRKGVTRVYSHGSTTLAKDDPQLKQVVRELGAAAYASEAIVLATANALARARQAAGGADRQAARAAAQQAEIEVNEAQIAIAGIVPRAGTQLFDALGASAVRQEAALDRHWRNARTILSHDPAVYRARTVGDYLVNGRLPELAWTVGVARPPATLATEAPHTPGVAA